MIRNSAWLFLIAAAVLAGPLADAAGGSQSLNDAVKWLEGESHRLILASRRTMKDGAAAFPPQVGIGYEAFWLRDFAYTLEGSVDSYSDKELLDASRLFIRSLRADGAGVDCVGFDGRLIYQPGGGSMGANPVADGSQFTVAVAWHAYRKTHDLQFLKESIDALVKAMNAVPRNPETKLVHIKPGGVYWETCRAARDTYQNGGYWATPAGWFVYTLDRVDPALADQTVLDLVADFRTGGACEWMLGDKRQLPNYLASACLPLAGIRAMLEHRH